MSSLASTVIPTLDLGGSSTPLANQVAGHQNVRSDASGSLPSLPMEIAFYQTVNSAPRSSKLAKIKPFLPQFYGTLKLEGQLDAGGKLSAQGMASGVPESVVLENLSYNYTHPNILDAKLGTKLYDPHASEEKKERMERAARETTSAETGLRWTGCQTWHQPSQSYIFTPKSFGKSLSVSTLPTAPIRFFPSPTDVIPSLVLPPSPPPTATSPQTLKTDSGEATIAPHLPLLSSDTPIPTAASQPESTSKLALPLDGTYRNHAIPASTMVRVLDLIDMELAKLEGVLRTLEMRFIGSSVLVVYEGDHDRLEDSLKRWEAKAAKAKLIAGEKARTGVSTSRADFGERMDGDDYDDDEDEENDDDEDDEEGSDSNSDSDSDDLDGVKEDARAARRCPPFTVRMIDFAHTWIAEGEGVDEGVLKGLGTLRGLLKGRREELAASAT